MMDSLRDRLREIEIALQDAATTMPIPSSISYKVGAKNQETALRLLEQGRKGLREMILWLDADQPSEGDLHIEHIGPDLDDAA